MQTKRASLVKRPAVIIALAIVAVVAFWVYLDSRPPPGIEFKGSEEVTVAWVSLATAALSFGGSLIGLVLKMIELRQQGRKRA